MAPGTRARETQAADGREPSGAAPPYPHPGGRRWQPRGLGLLTPLWEQNRSQHSFSPSSGRAQGQGPAGISISVATGQVPGAD